MSHRKRRRNPPIPSSAGAVEEIPRRRRPGRIARRSRAGGQTRRAERMEPVNGAVASQRAREEVGDRRQSASRAEQAAASRDTPGPEADQLAPDRDTPGREAEEVSRHDSLTRDDRANLLRYMAMMRSAEERAITLYRQGKVPGSFYDGRGQEAISVGSSFVLGPHDRMCILHRDLGAHFVRGVTPDRYLGNYMGRSGGVTRGREGNMHFGDPALGCVGMVSMLPDMAPVAAGMALTFKMRHERRVAMTYFGEGSSANGQWHEAMNFAGVHGLPVVFVL